MLLYIYHHLVRNDISLQLRISPVLGSEDLQVEMPFPGSKAGSRVWSREEKLELSESHSKFRVSLLNVAQVVSCIHLYKRNAANNIE